VYGLLCISTFIGIFQISKKAGSPWLCALLTILSYPMIFAVDRGNLALIVFILLLFAMTTEKATWATLAVALAASMKLTPVIFLLPIILSRPISVAWILNVLKQFFGWFILINLVAILINGLFLTPSMFNPIVLFTKTISSYGDNHVSTMQGLGYGSSLYMPTAYIASLYAYMPVLTPVGLAIIIYAIIIFFLLFKRDLVNRVYKAMDQKNMTYLLCVSFTLLMPVTGDYYLLIMMIPLLAFPKTSFSFLYFVFYGLLLGAKNFEYIGIVSNNFISWQVFLNPMLLLLLLLAEFDQLTLVKRDAPAVRFGEIGVFRMLNKGVTVVRNFLSSLSSKTVKIIIIVIAIGALSVIIDYNYRRITREAHNIQMGLPQDFNATTYLEINPQIVDFWKSKGINDSDEALVSRAEEHYITFGVKEGLHYK
jgi:hypothetical protein